MPIFNNHLDEDSSDANSSFVRMTHIARAIVILGVAIVLLFGDVLHINQVQDIDPFLRYSFGAISLLYGSFRLYRGLKKSKY